MYSLHSLSSSRSRIKLACIQYIYRVPSTSNLLIPFPQRRGVSRVVFGGRFNSVADHSREAPDEPSEDVNQNTALLPPAPRSPPAHSTPWELLRAFPAQTGYLRVTRLRKLLLPLRARWRMRRTVSAYSSGDTQRFAS